MFCGNCGQSVNDGSKFCPSCGAQMNGTINVPPSQNTPIAQSTPNPYTAPNGGQQGYYQQPNYNQTPNYYQQQQSYYQQPGSYPVNNRTDGSGFATAGFVIGIISVVFGISVFLGLPFSILGLILSAVGKKKLKKCGGKTSLATAGIIINVLSLIFTVLIAGGIIAVAIMANGYYT